MAWLPSATSGSGAGGSVAITANALQIGNGSLISSDTLLGLGNAGNVSVTVAGTATNQRAGADLVGHAGRGPDAPGRFRSAPEGLQVLGGLARYRARHLGPETPAASSSTFPGSLTIVGADSMNGSAITKLVGRPADAPARSICGLGRSR